MRCENVHTNEYVLAGEASEVEHISSTDAMCNVRSICGMGACGLVVKIQAMRVGGLVGAVAMQMRTRR